MCEAIMRSRWVKEAFGSSPQPHLEGLSISNSNLQSRCPNFIVHPDLPLPPLPKLEQCVAAGLYSIIAQQENCTVPLPISLRRETDARIYSWFAVVFALEDSWFPSRRRFLGSALPFLPFF